MTHTYLIAEIGQNHNGSVALARRLIDLVVGAVEEPSFGLELPGVDAVKLTKRDLDHELTDSMRSELYSGPQSFGRTYGQHREHLELSEDEHAELCRYARSAGVEFVETLCAPSCLSLLDLCTPDRLKVASRDLTNLPLIDALAETTIPLILSRGMSGAAELDTALDVAIAHHDDVTVLHCVSQYPAHPTNLNLRTIPYLRNRYPRLRVGYSDHSIGISAPLAAVALGAEVIEKHLTLDRGMKGSDHMCSVEPAELRDLTLQIRLLDLAMGEEGMVVPEEVGAARVKLGRSIASTRFIATGERIEERDLRLLSPGDGLRWADRGQLIGARARVDIPRNEIIHPGLVER